METAEQLEIKGLISKVAEHKASDLHLSAGNPPVLRVDGKLKPLPQQKILTADFIKGFADSILNEEQKKVLEKEREVALSYSFADKIRFKINIFYQSGHVTISLKYVPDAIPHIGELSLPKVVEGFTKIDKGLVLITGPFRSGKSSTLAAIVETINKSRSEHIITVEKPIEYTYIDNKSVVDQREVGQDTLSFTAALENILDEDADVVMVSEIEKPEVIKLVLELAESGRVVYAAMNADSVYKCIEKIISSFSPEEQEHIRIQLADSLKGVVTQKLLPKVGGGQVVIAEVLTPSQAVKTVIRDGSIYQINNIMQTSRGEGMVSLDRSLAEFVRSGDILLEDAIEVAVDPDNLRMMIKG